MADQTLLSELCGICNSNKSKYCCPGCAARTCSLPCYKRHQQWAQCSGKRDPTKYVKKDQLTTPAGIDHDYNFLTSIERGVDRAEELVSDLGPVETTKGRTPLKKWEVSDKHYAAVGVTVVKAPKGMSRQKQNNTHRSKRNKIIWTVEWIRGDQSQVFTETAEISSIISAYETTYERKEGMSSKKRKRGLQDESQPAKEPKKETPKDELPNESQPTGADTKIEEAKREDQASPVQKLSSGPELESHSNADPDQDEEINEPTTPTNYFYLLKPRTTSEKKVLIPLSPTDTLADSLRGRLVLEFPTIYVLSVAPEGLPDEFLLEDRYLEQLKAEQDELDQLLKTVDPERLKALSNGEDGAQGPEKVDSDAILEVLKKDIGSLV